MEQAERWDLRGTTLDARYQLGAPIGIGGTSVVFEATRLEDGANVVVKTLRETFAFHAELVMRLKREAEVARTVHHPGIVRVLDEGWLEDGSPYLVLERLDGECLARLLRRVGPLPADVVAVIALRTAAILHAAHTCGYVHRDVKPEHIVLDRTRDGWLDVRLLDFGVCSSSRTSVEERESERGRVYGTPAYCSPEQASGKPDLDGRADLFSLGSTMFEALSGRVPFGGNNVANLLRRIIREDAPRLGLLLPELDLAMDAIVARALSRVPDSRFASARALARALLPRIGERRRVEMDIANMIRSRSQRHDMRDTLRDMAAVAA